MYFSDERNQWNFSNQNFFRSRSTTLLTDFSALCMLFAALRSPAADALSAAASVRACFPRAFFSTPKYL